VTAQDKPELIGLVLGGGRSRRMGQEKGRLSIHDRPQAEHCVAMLEPHCHSVILSLRQDQANEESYEGLVTLTDDAAFSGPAAGLLTAWQKYPQTALLVLAVDMPLIDHEVLDLLVNRRETDKIATAYRHPDGIIEPLCTIWEPAAADLIRDAAGDGLSVSLRRVLERADVRFLEPAVPGKLASVNTPEDLELARRALETR